MSHVSLVPNFVSNGQVERVMKIVKDGLKRATKQSLVRKLSILFRYRFTPTQQEVLLGRHRRCCLDLVKPDLSQQVQHKQLTQMARKGGREEEVIKTLM